MTQPADTRILVRATKMGFYDSCRIRPGMNFTIANESEFAPSWMVREHDPNARDDLAEQRQAAWKLRNPHSRDAVPLTTTTNAGTKHAIPPVAHPVAHESVEERITRRGALLTQAKEATKCLFENRFYKKAGQKHPAQSPIHWTDFRQWRDGSLKNDSATTLNFERWLQDLIDGRSRLN